MPPMPPGQGDPPIAEGQTIPPWRQGTNLIQLLVHVHDPDPERRIVSNSPSWPPQSVGGYRLLRQLGKGGFGEVYLGEKGDGEYAAVKILHSRLAGDVSARTRFEKELEQIQRVSSFCIAPVLDADPHAPVPWIATEYIRGPSLTDAVLNNGPRRGVDLHRLAVTTATALTAIHSAGVLHRDLKPDNIMLAADGPRVIDFGISRILESACVLPSGQIGTPGYMAPEQLNDVPLTPAVDVFAWGTVLVFAATGRQAFPVSSVAAWMRQLVEGEPVLDGLEEPFLGIVRDCLAKDPAARPSAQELLMRVTTLPLPSGRNAVSPPLPVHDPVPRTRLGLPSEEEDDGIWDDWDAFFGEDSDLPEMEDSPLAQAQADHRLGKLIAATAVALVRAGLPYVSDALLLESHFFLRSGVEIPAGISYSEELEWAARPYPEGGGFLLHFEGRGWRPTEPLFESTREVAVPLELWLIAVANARAPSDVALNALNEGDTDSAVLVLRYAAKEGDPISKMMLGTFLTGSRQYRAAERLLREAMIFLDMPEIAFELGKVLHETERFDEAETWFRRSADEGFTKALAHLGTLYEGMAEEVDAERYWREAAKKGDPLGMVLLSSDLIMQGRATASRKWYERALATAGPGVLIEAGDLYRGIGAGPEHFYYTAIREGHPAGQERLDSLSDYWKRGDADIELFDDHEPSEEPADSGGQAP